MESENNSSLQRRFQRFQATLAEKGIDAVVIDSNIHLTYLLGFCTESSSQLIVPSSTADMNPILITSTLEEEIVKAKKPWNELEIIIPQYLLGNKTKDFLEKKKVHKVEFDKKKYLVPDNVLQQEITSEFNSTLGKQLKTAQLEMNFPGLDLKSLLKKSIANNAVKQIPWENQTVLAPRFDEFTAIADIFHDHHVKVVGLEYELLTYQNYLSLINTYRKTTEDDLILKDITEVLQKQRSIKDLDELELMKKAASIGDLGCAAAVKVIHEGGTELEAAADAEYAMRKAGSEKPSFDTIVVSGLNSAFPHGHATHKTIEPGDLVTVDLGAVNQGYCSDMTRTVIAQEEIREETQKIMQIVNGAEKLALDSVKVGLNWADLDLKVREYFNQQNVLQFYNHSLGHGVGVDVHEMPYVSFRQAHSDKKLEVGMVFTVEPGIYIPGTGGARTEDTIVLKDDGYEKLTQTEIWEY